MQCENRFCIYWEEDSCLLRSIALDAAGCCTSCELVELDEKELTLARARGRDAYEKA